eukprot:gene1328-32685_t
MSFDFEDELDFGIQAELPVDVKEEPDHGYGGGAGEVGIVDFEFDFEGEGAEESVAQQQSLPVRIKLEPQEHTQARAFIKQEPLDDVQPPKRQRTSEGTEKLHRRWRRVPRTAGGNSTFTGGASAHAGGNSTHASRTKETWEHSSEAGGIDPESSHSHARECEIEARSPSTFEDLSRLSSMEPSGGPPPWGPPRDQSGRQPPLLGIHHSGQGPPLGTPQDQLWTATPPVGIHPSGEFPHPETGTPAMPVPGSFHHRDEMASGSTPLGMSPTLGGSYMEAPLDPLSVSNQLRSEGAGDRLPAEANVLPSAAPLRAQPTLFPDPPTVNKISKHQGLIIPSAPNASDQQSQPQGPPTAPLVQGGPGRQPPAISSKRE